MVYMCTPSSNMQLHVATCCCIHELGVTHINTIEELTESNIYINLASFKSGFLSSIEAKFYILGSSNKIAMAWSLD